MSAFRYSVSSCSKAFTGGCIFIVINGGITIG